MTRRYRNPRSGYDPACETLAEHFLNDDPINDPLAKGSLAAAIQSAVEDWYLNERSTFGKGARHELQERENEHGF